MLTIYRTDDGQLQTLNDIIAGCWINMVDPQPAEIHRVSEELGIPIDYLTYPLDVNERARTEKAEGAMIVASVYGMNVDLPFQERQHAFWIVMGIALGLAGIMVYVFWKRDWF